MLGVIVHFGVQFCLFCTFREIAHNMFLDNATRCSKISKRSSSNWHSCHRSFQVISEWISVLCCTKLVFRGKKAEASPGNLHLPHRNLLISPIVPLLKFLLPQGPTRTFPLVPQNLALVMAAWKRADLLNNWQEEIIGLGDNCCLQSFQGAFTDFEETG